MPAQSVAELIGNAVRLRQITKAQANALLRHRKHHTELKAKVGRDIMLCGVGEALLLLHWADADAAAAKWATAAADCSRPMYWRMSLCCWRDSSAARHARAPSPTPRG